MSDSIFHWGEKQMQIALGVRERVEAAAPHFYRDHLPEQHREFYQQLPFLLAGHLDKAGWPWASMLFGEPGFIQCDTKNISLATQPLIFDPLNAALESGLQLGFLGIQPETRRRNRMWGELSDVNEDGLRVCIHQTLGNCPKYIQARIGLAHKQRDGGAPIEVTQFDGELSQLISRADTFFVASGVVDSERGPASADVSHRGGRPGFVRVDDSKTLTVPDFVGNFLFNTLGNFIAYPRAGLLFVDFEEGHLLTLTGQVELVFDPRQVAQFKWAERLWRFQLERGIFAKQASPLRWRFGDFSPQLP